MSNDLLVLDEITKIYKNGVVANRNVSFRLREGEIHAICGENGAGKTTLMKILYGLEQPSRGRIILRGKETAIASPRAAIGLGIGMVHQHFMLVPSFTVAENLFLGIEPLRAGLVIDISKAIAITRELAQRYGFSIDPSARAQDVSVGMMQKVEILKTLYRGATILILDEPTAVLTPQETDELFAQLANLKKSGHTVVFISHKLKEVKEISDRITVIRRGETQGVFTTAEVSEEEISRLMVGRDVATRFTKGTGGPGPVRLRVDGLTCMTRGARGVIRNVSFSVREGEILCVAGVEGNGQRELIDALTGGLRPAAGSLLLDNVPISGESMKRIRSLGMSYIPEDRMNVGSALEGEVGENLIAARVPSDNELIGAGPFLRLKEIASLAVTLIKRFQIACSGPRQRLSMLSGGNIQKVVVARECAENAPLLIADQPTRGVDVGAASAIHQRLLEMRENRTAILMVSADLNEVLELSDRLIVMYQGEVVAHFANPAQLSERELGLYMLGLRRQTPEQIAQGGTNE